VARYGFSRTHTNVINPSPTGERVETDFGPIFLGRPVTIRGDNGFSAMGRAILDFGDDFPQQFQETTKRQSVYIQSDYSVRPELTAVAGFHYENESGFTNSQRDTERNNFSS